jgi:hypothetical protein
MHEEFDPTDYSPATAMLSKKTGELSSGLHRTAR